jgi:hypothetical protein
MGVSRSFIHGIEELCVDWSGNGVGLSRECSSRESGGSGGSRGDDGESSLSGFLLFSLLLGLVFLVADSLGHDVGEEFEVVYTSDCTG